MRQKIVRWKGFFYGRRLPGTRTPRPLPLNAAQVYSGCMIQLPASYQEYLAGKSESLINTVRPILMQSAADRLHGVRVVVHPHDHQAHLDDTIPFGTVIEDID